MRNIFIVIPAFNEEKMIGVVIDDVKSCGYSNIIIVDDGSRDETYRVAKSKEVFVVRHLINRGKGAATQTGFDAAKKLGAEFVVTIDADGQHNPSDIQKLLTPLIEERVDVALGSRIMSNINNMPLSRRVANLLGNLITFIFYGIYVSDSQSGFRAYNKVALSKIKTTFDRYEFESEILHQIFIHKLRYLELPIEVRYSDYSLNKYKNIVDIPAQKFSNGFNMVFKMIIKSITT